MPVLGDREVCVVLAGGADSTAQAHEAARLFAVVEAIPIEDFSFQHFVGQSSQALGQDGGGLRSQLLGQLPDLLLSLGHRRTKPIQVLDQPLRQLELLPGGRAPPNSAQPITV